MERAPVTGDAEESSDDRRTRTSRRRFVQAVGAGVAASAGVPATAAAQQPVVVSMGNDYFDPVGLHVEPGTTVRFEVDEGTHTATAYEDRIPNDAAPFDSGTLSSGAFEHTLDEPGTYDYYCRPHQSTGMVGRIVVGDPGGPAEASPIPDGEAPAGESIVESGSVPADDADGGGHGGMMSSGPGMMGDGGPGWMLLVPIGFVTAAVSLVGGVAYWAARRGRSGSSGDQSAMAVLEKEYARGEIDEEEFERRRGRLRQSD